MNLHDIRVGKIVVSLSTIIGVGRVGRITSVSTLNYVHYPVNVLFPGDKTLCLADNEIRPATDDEQIAYRLLGGK